MNLPQIQIRTTDAKLGISITKAQQSIRQPKASLNIEQPSAKIDIETTSGKLRIDSSQSRRDLGLIGPLESTRKYASEGRKKLMAGIARRVREGNQMMDVANGKNSIPAIAKQNAFPPPDQLGIKFIPSVGSVKLDYIPSKLNIDVQLNKPIINSKANKPILEYTPGDVSGYMLQYPSIDIDVIV